MATGKIEITNIYWKTLNTSSTSHVFVTPRKYWLITQEAVAPSRYDWKIVDWDVKLQHKRICDVVY